MADEGISELLGVVIDVFGEEEHDHNPYIVRRDLDISVVVVGLQEGRKEAIIEDSTAVSLAGLLIGQ